MGAENLYNSGIPGTYLGLPINNGLAPGDKGYTPPPQHQPVNNWETLSNFLNGVVAVSNEGKGAYPGPSTVPFNPSDPTGSSDQLRAALPKPQPNVPVQSPKIALPPAEPQTLGQITQQQIPAMSPSPRTKEEFYSGVRRNYSGNGVSETSSQPVLYSPTNYGSDSRNQGLSRNAQPELNISIPENEKKYHSPGIPPIPPGFVDIGNAIKEAYNWLENTGSDKLTPSQARNEIIVRGEVPVGLSPEEATKLLANAKPASEPSTTQPAIPIPPQQAAAETNGALSYLGNKSVEVGLANRTKGADLVANQGFTQVDNLQAAPGNYVGNPFFRKTTDITLDQLQKSDPARYKALMELQALREADAAAQAKQYQQTGLTAPPIVTKDKYNTPVITVMQTNSPVTGRSLDPNAPKPMDLNNLEEYRVEIPGKGWMTGIRQKDPNRPQGTLSVVPGLSDAERQQVAQIEANQARQAAYGVSRRTGELYDAALQHQQQQAALAGLKQLQLQQEQAHQNRQLSLEERKAQAAENQNALMNEYNAGRLAVDRGNMLTQGRRAEQQSAHDRLARQAGFMKDQYGSWLQSPLGLKSKNPWDEFATTNLGVLSSGARTNELPKFTTPYASKTAGMIDIVYPDGKTRTVPYVDYIEALSQQASNEETQ